MRNAHALRRTHVFELALSLFVMVLILFGMPVNAAYVDDQSVTLGTSAPSAQSIHTFRLGIGAPATVGSVRFEYCVNDPFPGQPCVAPSGLDVSSVAITQQSGITGFTIHGSTTQNDLILTRVPGVVGPANLAITVSGVTNPDTVGTLYVRMSVHPTNDASGPFDYEGGTAISIANGSRAAGYVPPYLTFCVGVTVASNCSAATGSYVGLGELTTTSARLGQSQYAGATNDFSGFSVSVIGPTMTSGNNIVTALGVPTNSIPGTSQFGINLRANTNPSGGLNPSGAGSSTPLGSYNSPNQFMFSSGATISNSTRATAYNVMTVSYMVNVSPAQPAGVYTTTLTYIAVAAF